MCFFVRLNVIWSRSFFYIVHFEILNWLIRCMRTFKLQLKFPLPICRFTEMSWKSTVLSSNPAPPSSWKTSSWLQLRETATWLSPSTIWWNYTRWNDLSRLLIQILYKHFVQLIFQASDGAGSAEICRLTKEDIERATRAVEDAERKMKMAAKPPSQASSGPRGQFSFNVTTFPGSTQESDSIISVFHKFNPAKRGFFRGQDSISSGNIR